jgi:hypothetical protein
MTVRIATTVPDVVGATDRELYVGRPVRGTQLANIASACNSLLGWRGLRMTHCQCSWDDTAAETVPATQTIRLRWTTSPLARFVGVHAWVCCQEPLATTGATLEVQANLYTTVGVLIDGPIYWRYTPAAPANPGHGALRPVAGALAGVGAQHGTQVSMLSTGWLLEVDTAYQGPRLLDLGSTAPMTDVEVVLTTQNVRVYSATALEAFRPEV